MRKIGYARVSTSTQSLDRQIGALRAERCDEVYREKASGKATNGGPQLEKAIDVLGAGDVLVVAEWDRAYIGDTQDLSTCASKIRNPNHGATSF